MAVKKSKKQYKITISLSENDYTLLKLCAKQKKISKSMIVRQVVRNELRIFKDSIGELPAKNQLGLFDVVQTDIFGNREIQR